MGFDYVDIRLCDDRNNTARLVVDHCVIGNRPLQAFAEVPVE